MLFVPMLLLLAPAGEDRADALARYGQARWLAGTQQLASAAKQLEQSVKLDPAAVAPKRDLARLYAELGRDAAAIRLARQVLAADPGDVPTARTLARLLGESHQHREAAEVLSGAIEKANFDKSPGRKLSLLRDLARGRQLAQDWLAARTAWTSAIEFIDAERERLLRDGFDAGDLHRERAAAFEKLGQVRVELQQFTDAIDAFDRAAAMFRKDAAEPNAAARLDWNLSGAYAAANEPEKALAAIERFLALKPQSVRPYRRYAEIMRQAGREREVEAGLERLAGERPNTPAIRWVFLSEMARRDFTSAHLRFLQLLPATDDEAFFELLAETYSARDHPHELLAVAEALFPPTPEGPKPAAVPQTQSDRQQAFAHALGRQTAFAPALLNAAKDRHLQSPELCDLIAWLAERADRPADYERALRESLRIGGINPFSTSFDKLATCLARQRRWADLLSLCGSIRFDPRRDAAPYLAILRGNALAELGRGDEALELLKKQRVATFAIRRHTAGVLGILGRHKEMLDALEAMLDEFPDETDRRRIRTLRAEAFHGLNRFDDMEAELRGLIEDDPDDPLVLNNLGYNLADKNRKLPEAEVMIRHAIDLDRRERAKAGEARLENGVYLDSLAWVLFRRGKLAEARALLEQAVDSPEARADAIVWDHLGDVCYRLNDKPAAKQAWQHADQKYVGDHRGRQGGRADEVKRKLKLVE